MEFEVKREKIFDDEFMLGDFSGLLEMVKKNNRQFALKFNPVTFKKYISIVIFDTLMVKVYENNIFEVYMSCGYKQRFESLRFKSIGATIYKAEFIRKVKGIRLFTHEGDRVPKTALQGNMFYIKFDGDPTRLYFPNLEIKGGFVKAFTWCNSMLLALEGEGQHAGDVGIQNGKASLSKSFLTLEFA